MRLLNPELFVVLALATYRATRLVTSDSITANWRDRLELWAWDFDHPILNEQAGKYEARPRSVFRSYLWTLLTCALCLGVWVAAGVFVVLRYWHWFPAQATVWILAAAGVQCVLQFFTEAAKD